jgi:hypothetical protein
MNEQKIISIYQELLAGIQKIKSNNQELDLSQKLALAQLEDITAELKEKATKAGFGEKMVAAPYVNIDSSDDLRQLIDSSICTPAIKLKMQLQLEQYVAKGINPGKKNLWDTIQIIDKFYQANVLNINIININKRMRDDWKFVFGEEVQDLNLLVLAYQNSAKEAITLELDSLIKNKWKTSMLNIHPLFEKFLLDKKTWLASANAIDNAKAQFKIDLREFKLMQGTTDFSLGYLNFSNGKGQISGKLAVTKPILASQQLVLVDEYISLSVQELRNTVNVSKLFTDGASRSQTFLSSNFAVTLGDIVTFVAKVDLLSLKWDKIKELKNFTINPVGFRLQGSLHLANIVKGKTKHKETVINDLKTDITVSLGWDVSINWEKVNALKLRLKQSSKKNIAELDDLDKPSLDKDSKKFAEISKKQKNALGKADDILDAIKNEDLNALQKAAKEMGDASESANDLLKNTKWTKNSSLQQKAKDLLQETGEVIYKKIAAPLTTLATKFKYAKVIAKLIPGVNAIVTIAEVAIFVYGLVEWLRSVDGESWENYFKAAGNYLKDSYVGGWVTSFNQYMKG